MTIKSLVNSKRNQWAREAEMAFAQNGQNGVKMHRETWANNAVMVGWDGARANQFVPLSRAVEIYKAGWKIYV
jgi:hypothetical protein